MCGGCKVLKTNDFLMLIHYNTHVKKETKRELFKDVSHSWSFFLDVLKTSLSPVKARFAIPD